MELNLNNPQPSFAEPSYKLEDILKLLGKINENKAEVNIANANASLTIPESEENKIGSNIDKDTNAPTNAFSKEDIKAEVESILAALEPNEITHEVEEVGVEASEEAYVGGMTSDTSPSAEMNPLQDMGEMSENSSGMNLTNGVAPDSLPVNFTGMAISDNVGNGTVKQMSLDEEIDALIEKLGDIEGESEDKKVKQITQGHLLGAKFMQKMIKIRKKRQRQVQRYQEKVKRRQKSQI